jgi:hypothetical protein
VTSTHVAQDQVLNGVVLDLQHRLRAAQDELQRQDETIAALRAALMELAQLTGDSAATLAAVMKVARGVAQDRSLNGTVAS